MGCAYSHPVHPNRPHGAQYPHHHHKQPQMSRPDKPQTPRCPRTSNTYVSEPPKSPSSVARPHTTDKYAPRASYNPYDLPYSQRNYSPNSKSHAHTHASHEPRHKPRNTTIGDVSPPRHRSEMPRRNASYQFRDVSPLGSSRFEQPFEQAPAGSGRGVASTVGATFREGGVGGWENW